jgi:hypothetical protein
MRGFHPRIVWACGVFLHALLACSLNAASDPTLVIPEHERRYDIGLAYMPASRPKPMAWGLERIGAAADMIFMQGNFKDWNAKEAIDQELKFAREHKLKVYMSLDLLNYVPARAKIELPDGVTGDFTTPAVQKLYLDLVRRIARDFQPDYFVMLVEVDMHKKHNPASYAAYVKLFPQAVADVKRLSPNTHCGASLTYDEKHEAFKEFVADFDTAAGMLTVSTYPFWHIESARVPDSFLSDIAAFSKKPFSSPRQAG